MRREWAIAICLAAGVAWLWLAYCPLHFTAELNREALVVRIDLASPASQDVN
jgi:hypothetical protein